MKDSIHISYFLLFSCSYFVLCDFSFVFCFTQCRQRVQHVAIFAVVYSPHGILYGARPLSSRVSHVTSLSLRLVSYAARSCVFARRALTSKKRTMSGERRNVGSTTRMMKDNDLKEKQPFDRLYNFKKKFCFCVKFKISQHEASAFFDNVHLQFLCLRVHVLSTALRTARQRFSNIETNSNFSVLRRT